MYRPGSCGSVSERGRTEKSPGGSFLRIIFFFQKRKSQPVSAGVSQRQSPFVASVCLRVLYPVQCNSEDPYSGSDRIFSDGVQNDGHGRSPVYSAADRRLSPDPVPFPGKLPESAHSDSEGSGRRLPDLFPAGLFRQLSLRCPSILPDNPPLCCHHFGGIHRRSCSGPCQSFPPQKQKIIG